MALPRTSARARGVRTSDRACGAATIPGVGERRRRRGRTAARTGAALVSLAAVVALAASCASPPPSPLARTPLAPPARLAPVPATHDVLSGVLGALAAAGPASRLDGVRQDIFADYLAAMAQVGPTSTPELYPSGPYVLAYLVNAHVAWAVALGEARRLRRLDTSSLREIPFPLDRGTSTLAALEAEIARRAPSEPRLALFLNPGWKGGPPLPPSALEGHSLDWQLATQSASSGSTPGFWDLDRAGKVLRVSAFTDAMWGLPPEQPARARRLLELVPPPARLRAAVEETCGRSLERCSVASIPLDDARLFAPAPRG